MKKTNKRRRHTADGKRFRNQIGVNIKRYREKRKMSLGDVSKITGINRGQLWKIENGSNMTIGTLFKVCDAIGEHPCWMIPLSDGVERFVNE